MVSLCYTLLYSEREMIEMDKVSRFIVKYRNKILIFAILLLIPSVIGYLNTDINYDILSYLPNDCESMKGQKILDEDFNLASVGLMVTNDLNDKGVVELEQKIEKIDGVSDVLWRDDVMDITFPKEMLPKEIRNQLYSKGSTLMIVTFDEDTASQKTMNAISEIKKVSNKDCYLGGMSAVAEDTKNLANSEMIKYIGIAIILSLIVLYLGLESNVAPLIFMLGIAFPIIYNFGTNIFLGEISYITQALAAILQLAVTMDYSIFLLHRYQEEKKKVENTSNEVAMAKAIHATFTSITSSSITTIAGFITLCFMQLTLGKDIGLVMAKGVVLGVLCTIFVLPSLLMIFDKQIEKYTHKPLIRELKKVPEFVTKNVKLLLVLAVCIMIPMTIAQANVKQYYDLTSTLPKDLSSMIGMEQLKDKFDMNTTHFILVEDDLKTKDIQHLCSDLENIDGIETVLAYEKYIGGGFAPTFEPQAAKDVFENGGHKLIIANSKYHAATQKENKQLDEMRLVLDHYDKNSLITGEGALSKDLIATTNKDFKVVNVLSILAIFIIIMFTFKSIALAFILVMAIELAIVINMGIPFFTNTTLPFIAQIVIGTIQLGACVDYAILMTTRFKEELQNHNSTKEAMKEAIKKTSPSIITSGCSFFAACIGVAMISRMSLISSLCELLARGAIISVISIVFILPSILLICSPIIKKTTKDWPSLKGE